MGKGIHIVTVLLAFALCFALISCSQDSGSSEEIPGYEAEMNTNDLGGFTMKYYVSPIEYMEDECVLGYLVNTEFADLATKRIQDVEKELNCKIDIHYVVSQTVLNNLAGWVISGSRVLDASQDQSIRTSVSMRDGFLVGLSPYLDVKNTEKWGSIGMNMGMFWNDDQYGVFPATWPELFTTSLGYPFCVNEDIVAKANLTDPRELVENNTWTWDVFEEYLHQMTYDNGSYQVYGFATHPVYFVQMMFRSNGDMLLDITNKSLSVENCGYYTNTAFAALDRAYKILTETCADCIHPTTDRFVAANAFRAGEVGIVCSNTEFVIGTETSYVYTCDNFGVLPSPQGPDAKPGDYHALSESTNYTVTIPIICENIEETAMILEALYEPFEEYPTKESILDYMSKYTFHDSRDMEVFWKLSRNTEFAFFNEGARELTEMISGYSSKRTPAAEALEAFKSKYTNVFNNYIIRHYNGIKAVWGDEIG